MLKPEDLKKIMPSIPAASLESFTAALDAAMTKDMINTVTRASAFLAHLAHESGELRFWSELLNYNADQLLKMWPKRFTKDTAIQYGGKPEKIANFVYANRNGNGDEASGDGWRYRGRSPIQITFKNAYKDAGAFIGVDLVADPEKAAEAEHGFKIASWFWVKGAGERMNDTAKKRVPVGSNLNTIADIPDFEATTFAINGGLNGWDQRLKYYHKALEILGRNAQLT
jgi:putative chitinase